MKAFATKQDVFYWLTANRSQLQGLNNYNIQDRCEAALGRRVNLLHIRLWSNENETWAVKSFTRR